MSVKVSVKEVVKTTIEGVKLEMSLEDAQVLMQLFRSIGGSSDVGHPRAVTQSILDKLRSVGIKPADIEVRGSIVLEKKSTFPSYPRY